MNDDNLFVCFSDEALTSPQGSPPFHGLIKEVASTLDERTFYEFCKGCFEWHWYPIITSGFFSFPVHGDLLVELTDNRRLEAIGYAADICVREDRKRFISCLGILFLLCRSVEKPKPIKSLTKNFMRIRESVTRNAIDSNILFWFSKIAHYQFSTGIVPDGYEGSFECAGLNAPDKGWWGYGTSLDFPLVDACGWQNCPGGEEAVRKEVEVIRGGDFVLEYQRSVLHQGLQYWIWLYRNVSENPIWHWYVYVVTTSEGETTIHREAMHSVVSKSPEELVVQHAFGH